MRHNLLRTFLGISLVTTVGYSYAASGVVPTHIVSKNNYIVKITPANNTCVIGSGIQNGMALLEKNNEINAKLRLWITSDCPAEFKRNYVFQAYSYQTGWRTIPYELIKETDKKDEHSTNITLEIPNYDINLL